MARQFLSLTAFVVATTLTQHPVTAARPGAASPTIVDLGTLDGGFSDAFGINNDPDNIEVVGHSRRADGFTHGFHWTAATGMTDLGSLGRSSHAMDINNHGVIAGGSEAAPLAVPLDFWAVVWTMSSGVWTIEKLGRLEGTCCGYAYGLNNGSEGDPSTVAVVGRSNVPSGEAHAVMWQKATGEWLIEDLGTLPGDVFSYANDVNDSQTVVGASRSSTGIDRAFRWTPSMGMVALPGLGGDTRAKAIADNGDVAGTSIDAAGNSHAVRWRGSDNAIEDLGTLGGCCSEGMGINTAGTVVGWSDISRRGNQRAFLAKRGARMTELGGPRKQSAARALNDFATIAGSISDHAAIWKLP